MDVERVVAAVNPAAIVNAAAFTAVDGAEDERTRAFRINRDGVRRAAEPDCRVTQIDLGAANLPGRSLIAQHLDDRRFAPAAAA